MVNFEQTSLQVGDHRLIMRPAQLHEIIPLRQAILIDGTDRDSPIFEGDNHPATIHIGVFDSDNRPVACATLMQQPDHAPGTPGSPRLPESQTPAWRLRGMATDPAYQRKGVGQAVLRYIQQMLLESGGPTRLWCNARVHAVAFYRRAGWQSTGDLFMIPGVGQHVRMVRWL